MPTPHISATEGQIAPLVLMPGDPKRAERIAHDLLDSPELVSDVRGIRAFTGRYKGVRVSVMASGMGVPSIGIYATELYRFYGVQRIVRVGTCGGILPAVKVRDVVISSAAHTNSSLPGLLVPGLTISLAPSFNLLRAAVDAAAAVQGATVHVGPTYCSDHFYFSQPHWIDGLAKLGTLAVEMEAAGLYAVAMTEGREALAVLTASDHLLNDTEDMTSQERETSFQATLAVAAEALIS
jgi:purine-nucleoside phosphorylase